MHGRFDDERQQGQKLTMMKGLRIGVYDCGNGSDIHSDQVRAFRSWLTQPLDRSQALASAKEQQSPGPSWRHPQQTHGNS